MHQTGRTAGGPPPPLWRGARRSGGATLVVVMQATDVWNLNDRAECRWLRSPRDGSILVQREVSSPFNVPLQVAAQRALVPDDVIEALAADGADHALNERILPITARSRPRVYFAALESKFAKTILISP